MRKRSIGRIKIDKIKRRDFVNGSLIAAGSALFGKGAAGQQILANIEPSYYPPARKGLRGSHPGSNDHAHSRAWQQRSDWGAVTELEQDYDLVVVGGGLSGLAAAYFYQQKHGKHKKVLVLDNHDDFGGHAKRNEHKIDGQTLIGYGGSQSIVEPNNADQTILELFKDIGVDIDHLGAAYDEGFYRKHDLGGITYFNKASFGADTVVKHPYCNYPNYVHGLPQTRLSNAEAAQQAPLSKKGKAQLLRVLNGGLHMLPVPPGEVENYIATHAYFDYLQHTLGVDDPGVLRMARHSGIDWGSSPTELMSIASAKSCGALGFAPVAEYDKDNPYIYHYPDGNAGVARALVKKMIPSVAEGDNAEALVLAKFNYSELDKANSAVRIRLNSTVVNVRHVGDAHTSNEVLVTYIAGNQSYRVKGKGVVMACYNMMVPHIVAGLSEEQSSALKLQSKSPLQYTTVGLRNWRAIKEIGMGVAMSPGNMHQAVLMDFPISIGGYNFTADPADPCIIQMISCPYGETVGAERDEQFREARYRMLNTRYEDYESEIRSHLNGMLPKDEFDFDKDVASISVNRWAHGYTLAGPGNSTKIGRQPFGRITIANCDSAPGADAKTAMAMASRAVNELG